MCEEQNLTNLFSFVLVCDHGKQATLNASALRRHSDAAVVPTKESMLIHTRHQRMLALLQSADSASNKQIANALKVSVMTVRRDLADLEGRGLVTRVYGGAYAKVKPEVSYATRLGHRLEEKHAIGQIAASMVREGESIYLDAGSTTMEIARQLRDSKLGNIRVVTHAVNIAAELSGLPNLHVVQIGGEIYRESYSATGSIAVQTINQFRFNRCFLAAQGMSPTAGITDWSLAEVEVKRAALANSSWNCLVADSSKWGHELMAQTCSLSGVNAIITDSKLSPGAKLELARLGIETILTNDLTPTPPEPIKRASIRKASRGSNVLP